MPNLTLEEQKEIYARELAAYTLRQWKAACDSLDGTKKGEDGSSSTSTTSDEYENSQTDGNSKAQTLHTTDCVQVVDFARISPKPGDVASHNAVH